MQAPAAEQTADLTDELHISIVDPYTAKQYWKQCYYPLISAALEHSPVCDDTPGMSLQKIVDQQAVLIQVDDGRELLAVCLIELIQGKVGQLLHVNALAGENRERWLGALCERLKRTAEEMGACSLSMTGRPGWTKELPQYGFRTDLVTMTVQV